MRLLYPDEPTPGDGHAPALTPPDLLDRYARDLRPASHDRPWLALNMVTSVDGATAVAGVSGSLGGATDKLVFGYLRSLADVVLAGAGTVRAEDYRQPRATPAYAEQRRRRGQPERPRLAVVSGRLAFDPEARLFAEARSGVGELPLIYTTSAAPAEARAALDGAAEVVDTGTDEVDFDAVLGDLRRRGHRFVLCEGGPTINGELIARDLVDEVCWTLTPTLAAGGSQRLATGPDGPLRHLRLARMVHDDEGAFLLRYVRHRSPAPGARPG